MAKQTNNAILSSVMGLCVADALGVPVEFTDREELEQNPVTQMRAFGTYNQPAGTWSDDTTMTLCLVDSLATGLDYSDIMKKFAEWYNEGAYTPFGEVFDIGIATQQAIIRFNNGKSPLECGGSSEADNGNGSLMRILPILFYVQATFGDNFAEIDEAYDIIHNTSALTHAHKRSLIACGIYISIAAQLSSKIDIKTAINQGIEQAITYYTKHDAFREQLAHFERIRDKNFGETNRAYIESSGYVVHTLEAAIWCLLTTESYKDCVLKAVNLGEDTDTTAAVAGGLAGLYYGYKTIPEEWLKTIVERDYVEGLCHQLHTSFQGT